MRVMRSKQSEITLENLFPQSYGTFKQRGVSKTNCFFDITYGTTFFIFDHIVNDLRDEPA